MGAGNGALFYFITGVARAFYGVGGAGLQARIKDFETTAASSPWSWERH
jgi:hypothetical protein